MANDDRFLCLLDCSAIQRYVFGSNMLKSNVGASHVVAQIYDTWILKALKEVFPEETDKDIEKQYHEWKEEKKQAVIQLDEHPQRQWETGYVGGGNALMMFRREEDAKKFIQTWTRMLLKEAPGIRPAVALLPTTRHVLEKASEKVFEDLFAMLEENKSRYIAETTLPRHGFTAECKLTGLAAECLHRFPDGTIKEISSVSKTKLDNYNPANDLIKKKFESLLKGKYEFPEKTENMGQTENVENHVAIVHIDGNDMGKMFKACTTLAQKRRLSVQVDKATICAMRKTLEGLLAKFKRLKEEVLDAEKLELGGDKELLPMRPIILNGDDVTFICDSRLAFFLAETFMSAFAENEVDVGQDKKRLSSCAGIAIIKTKYPFYRGYMLAEALCSNAKKKYRQYHSEGKTSWLDFHISHRGLPSNLGEMREDQYRVGNASLLWRPWQITVQKEWSAFNQLKEAIKYFTSQSQDIERWPKRKLQDLEEILALGKKRTEEFITMMEVRKLKLPPIAGLPKVQSEGWESVEGELRTPYYDILEAMEFYPDCLFITCERPGAKRETHRE